MKNHNCSICTELAKDSSSIGSSYYSDLVEKQKNVLMETDNFCVIPSYGPLDKSHVMIVPKIHVNNFVLLGREKRNEANMIMTSLSNYHLKHFNVPLIFFESGAGTYTDHSGGCIIHAHIHCVAYSEKFESFLLEEISLTEEKKSSVFDIKHGYVWFKNERNLSYFCNRPLLPSQFLRYIYLASKVGSQRWNWRRDINIEGIKEVIIRYSNLNT